MRYQDISDETVQDPDLARWFAGSKVVDKRGQPLVVYHGTNRSFDQFSADANPINRVTASQHIDIPGIYFTSSALMAGTYASASKRKSGGEGRPRVIAAYLKMLKPLYITDLIKAGRKEGLSFGDAKRKALTKLDKNKHDGVIFRGDAFNPAEYIVIDPKQIRVIKEPVTELERSYMGKHDPQATDFRNTGSKKSRDSLGIKVNGFELRYRTVFNEIEVSLWDHEMMAAKILFKAQHFRNIRAYTVMIAGVGKRYQGRGLMMETYKILVSKLGLCIAARDSHSTGARKQWMRLSQDPTMSVYGLSIDDNRVYAVRPNDAQTELQAVDPEIDLYDNSFSGLIMAKKNSKDDKALARMAKDHEGGADIFGVGHNRVYPMDEERSDGSLTVQQR